MAEKGRKQKEQSRAHGEGSIYQWPDGTWAGVSRYVDPETGEKEKHFVYGKIWKEAAAKKREQDENHNKGIIPTKAKITVSSWLDHSWKPMLSSG